MGNEHEPREGVDYIVDLYAVSGVEPDATDEVIKKAINERSMEYHPDRLEGVAPSFREQGERIMRQLNYARTILLQPDNRAAYDKILTEWDGPVATTGMGVTIPGWELEQKLKDMPANEVEDNVKVRVDELTSMMGYNPGLLLFLEDMVDRSGNNVANELRQLYDDALAERDNVLLMEESIRGKLLGLEASEKRGLLASSDYGENMAGLIQDARASVEEAGKRRALGGVATQLALLAGEPALKTEIALPAQEHSVLPAYFDDQAEKVQAIADVRAMIVEKRLTNLLPEYPEAELQTERKNHLALGLRKGDECRWMGFMFDHENEHAEGEELPDELRTALLNKSYAEVIKKEYAVMIIPWLEGLDPHDLIGVAIAKYTDQYS